MKKTLIFFFTVLFVISNFSFGIVVNAQTGEWNNGVPRNFVPSFEAPYQMSSWLRSSTYDIDMEAYEDLRENAYKGEMMLSIVRMYQAAMENRIIPSGYELDKYSDNYTIEPNSSQETQLGIAVRLGMLTGEEYNGIWYMNLGDYLTRGQAAKILATFTKNTSDPSAYTRYRNEFSDIDGHWAEEYIKYCYEHDLLSGKGNGIFDPDGCVKKEELIQILVNIQESNSMYSLQNLALALNQTFCVTTLFDRINSTSTPRPATNKLITSSKGTYSVEKGRSITVTLNHEKNRYVTVELLNTNYGTNTCCSITNNYTNQNTGTTTVNIDTDREGVALLRCNYTYGTNSNVYLYVPIFVISTSSYYVPVDDVRISTSNIELEVGRSFELSSYVRVMPTNASNKYVFYNSSNPTVATVDYSTGRIYAKESGTAYIYVLAENYAISIKVTVTDDYYSNSNSYDRITSITLDETSGYFIVGDKFDLKDIINVRPSSYDTSTLTYIIDKTSVATVSKSGIVTMKKEGNATITIRSYSGESARYRLYVSDDGYSSNSRYDNIKSIELDYEGDTFYIGDKFDLKDIINVSPTSYDTSTLTYVIDNSSIATVSKSGIVTMKREGDATITIRSYSGVKATFDIYVMDNSIVFEPDEDGGGDVIIPLEPDDDINFEYNYEGKMEFGLDSISINVGDTYNLLSIFLGNIDDVIFTSSDQSLAKIKNNIITAISAGTVIITAENSFGYIVKLSVNINN